MHTEKYPLCWDDNSIPHRLWLEPEGASSRLVMEVIKDITPEVLTVKLPYSAQTVAERWGGSAIPVSPSFDDGRLFTQTRVLFNLPTGCVLWTVTHIMQPNGKKMSADKLAFIPNLRANEQSLQALWSSIE